MIKDKVSRDFGKTRLLIVALALFLIGIVLSMLILFMPDEDFFQYYLNQADEYTAAGRSADVHTVLNRAARYADTRQQWFSLFKRSYIICRDADDYHPFNELVEKSRKFIKAGPDHDAVHVASLLWTDQYEKAAATLYSIQQTGYETLIAESLLSYEVFRNYNLKEISPLEFIKDKITFREDPEFFQIIGTLADNEVLMYNAALLYMEEGVIEGIPEILGKLSVNRINPYSLGVLYYDLGFYEEALNNFLAQDVLDEMNKTQRSAMKQQIGDVQFLLGNKKASMDYYEQARELDPGASWKLIRNLARMYYEKGYSRKSRALLDEGMKAFPERKELLMDYVPLFHQDFPVAVRRTLDSYLSRYPEDVDTQLMNMHYFPDQKSPARYQTELWDLFNQDNSSESVTRFLLWYLAGIGDRESMKIVLQRYRPDGETPHWYYFYESVLHLLDLNSDSALASMEAGAAIRPGWVYELDMGLIKKSMDLDNEVMAHLEKAAELLKVDHTVMNRSVYLSRIYLEMGDMLLERKEFERAAQALDTALGFDPGNTRAQTLVNRIQ